jgi:hypothetical protein
MDTYERNMGKPHPLASHATRSWQPKTRSVDTFEQSMRERNPLASYDTHSEKRNTGPAPLVEDLQGRLWHGTVSVGTPATDFKGSSL